MPEERTHQASRDLIDQVESIVKNSGSSFYTAMRLLGPEKRHAMYAVYAFCRQIDDIADEPAPLEAKQKALSVWRNDIEALYTGREPVLDVAKALVSPVKRFSLPKEEFIALIDGMEMDIPDGMRAPKMDELELYCRRVAGAVGILSVRIFGESSDDAVRFAVTLGEALQLTNILRDMVEDMDLGRLYVPEEALEKAGIAVTENTSLSEILADPSLKIARGYLAERAKLRFMEASAALEKLDAKKMKPAVLMKEMYHKIFLMMEKRGWEKLEPRPKPSKFFAVKTALRVFIFGK